MQTRSGKKGEAAEAHSHARRAPHFTLHPDTSLARLTLAASLGLGAHMLLCRSARTPCAVVGYAQCLVNFPPYPKSDPSSIQGVVGGAF